MFRKDWTPVLLIVPGRRYPGPQIYPTASSLQALELRLGEASRHLGIQTPKYTGYSGYKTGKSTILPATANLLERCRAKSDGLQRSTEINNCPLTLAVYHQAGVGSWSWKGQKKAKRANRRLPRKVQRNM